jgi:hypothetical protein
LVFYLETYYAPVDEGKLMSFFNFNVWWILAITLLWLLFDAYHYITKVLVHVFEDESTDEAQSVQKK